MAGLDDFSFKKDFMAAQEMLPCRLTNSIGEEVISLDVLDHLTSQYLVVISIQNFHRKVSICANSVYMYQAL